jgi:competence ComEA-like helix-hairpin-helix protein
MSNTNSKDLRSKYQRFFRLNGQVIAISLPLFVVGLLLVSLASPTPSFSDGRSEETAGLSTGMLANGARLIIPWLGAATQEFVEMILALALTITVMFFATVLSNSLQHSHAGQTTHKVLRGNKHLSYIRQSMSRILRGTAKSVVKYISGLLFLVLLFVLPIVVSLARGALLSPEELARYEAKLLGAIGSVLAFLIAWKLATGRARDRVDIAPNSAIDINTASKGDLESLLGIGPVLARLIIDYRDQVGYFERVEDITKVRGVGDKLFSQIRHKIKV